MANNKARWSELDEEDIINGEELSFLLPPRKVIGPNKNGIKKVIEYRLNEKGEKVKVTTTTRVRKILLTKAAVERLSWPKFGDAVDDDVGSKLTLVSKEEVFLERPKAKGNGTEENNIGGATLMLCRTCGQRGDHWTVMCPYKDLARQTDIISSNSPVSADGSTSSSRANRNSYIPPNMRGGSQRGSRSDMRHRSDENSVRVDCLSEDTRESDLNDLFRPFGPITRVSVATDRHTGLSRGFGYVNFVNKEDAQRAIDKLDGYGYDNLILKVEWCAPRSK